MERVICMGCSNRCENNPVCTGPYEFITFDIATGVVTKCVEYPQYVGKHVNESMVVHQSK